MTFRTASRTSGRGGKGDSFEEIFQRRGPSVGAGRPAT